MSRTSQVLRLGHTNRSAATWPDKFACKLAFDTELSHKIEAGSDVFLVPSQFEPCGLNQMYSLKYGTVPIVRWTGGLADSVQMWDPHTGQGTGIVFEHFDTQAIGWAIGTALQLFKDRAAWLQMVRHGMAQHFSWERQVCEYVRLYAELSGAPPGP